MSDEPTVMEGVMTASSGVNGSILPPAYERVLPGDMCTRYGCPRGPVCECVLHYFTR
jgi:hypothetical protein